MFYCTCSKLHENYWKGRSRRCRKAFYDICLTQHVCFLPIDFFRKSRCYFTSFDEFSFWHISVTRFQLYITGFYHVSYIDGVHTKQICFSSFVFNYSRHTVKLPWNMSPLLILSASHLSQNYNLNWSRFYIIDKNCFGEFRLARETFYRTLAFFQK